MEAAHGRILRVTLATVISPIAVIFPLGLFALLEPFIWPWLGYGLQTWIVVLVFALPIAFLATVFLGLPLQLYLGRKENRSIGPYVGAGVAVSCLASVFFWHPNGDDRIYPVLFVSCGFIVSLVFGMIARYR